MKYFTTDSRERIIAARDADHLALLVTGSNFATALQEGAYWRIIIPGSKREFGYWHLTRKPKTAKKNPVRKRAAPFKIELRRGQYYVTRGDLLESVWNNEADAKAFVKMAKSQIAKEKRKTAKKNPTRMRPLMPELSELVLYADNDGDLYRQIVVPIIKNLARKLDKGVYDHAKARKAWANFYRAAATKYAKEHGSPGDTPARLGFTSAVIAEAARDKETYEFQRLKDGEYSIMVAKKPRKTAKKNPFKSGGIAKKSSRLRAKGKKVAKEYSRRHVGAKRRKPRQSQRYFIRVKQHKKTLWAIDPEHLIGTDKKAEAKTWTKPHALRKARALAELVKHRHYQVYIEKA